MSLEALNREAVLVDVTASGRDVNLGRGRLGRRQGIAVAAEALEVKLNGLLHEFEDFLGRIRGGDAAGKVGNVGRVVVAGLLDEDGVPQEDGPEGAARQRPAC